MLVNNRKKKADTLLHVSQGEKSREADLYSDEGYRLLSELWLKVTCERKLMYEPSWLGIPIIQYPGDIVAMQELIWKVRPDIIIETGVAHGGSAIFYASILELIGKGEVIAIDVEIRKYNRVAIEAHPLSKRIKLIEGSSIDPSVIEQVGVEAKKAKTVLVTLDSNHSYEHVLKEMESYGPMVTCESYMVVMDGAQGQVHDIPSGKKEWREDNPLRAIETFIAANGNQWEIDNNFTRFGITSNPSGHLRRREGSPKG
jgi:cephalosporin hydroxylase